MTTEGRKIFIDCGANRGQSVARFRDLFPDHEEWEIYCFEPDLQIAAQIDLGANRGAVIAAAAWVYDGMIDFYRGSSTLGSSMYADKVTGDLAAEPTIAMGIDLPRFIRRNFSRRDYVILKLNIEGAEYPVLRRMVECGIGHLVNRLFVCWHHEKIPSISEEEHNRLIRDIEATGLKCEDFWG